MLKFITIFLLVVSCGSSNPTTNKIPSSTQNVTASTFTRTYQVDGVNINGRVIYIHYYNGSANQMNGEYFGVLKQGMISKGYQVVSFDCPKVDELSFIDGGKLYTKNYLEYLDWLIPDLEQNHGPTNELVIGGVSFGGLHTLVAVANRAHYFTRYFTVVSVVDLTVLQPYKGQNVDTFTALGIAPKLANTPGLMAWGGADTFVDFRLNKALADEIGPMVLGVEIPGYWHEVEQPQVDTVLNWL